MTKQGAAGTTYYKAVRPNGTDFRTGTVDYLTGGVIRHPSSERIIRNEASTYLSISVEPAETLIGGLWPCRLLRVQPVGEVFDNLSVSHHKRACLALEVIEELPAWQALGPNGEHVVALIERAESLTADQADNLSAAGYALEVTERHRAALYAAWCAARCVARGVARDTARYAARQAAEDAAGYAAGYAAEDAAYALVVRDVLTPEHYHTLTASWAQVIGKVHPDDEEWSE